MVTCSTTRYRVIPENIAFPIVEDIELGSHNKSSKAWSGEMIKSVCHKVIVNRLGIISKIE